MRRLSWFFCVILALVLLAGCEGDQLFVGSQWDVGDNHVSFSHGVAEWDTADNKLVLKFDLITGSSYPTAQVTVEKVSTLGVNQSREVAVKINLSKDESFESKPSDTEATAAIIFTRFDISPFGGVTGTIEGMARSVENPGDAPVLLEASFTDVPITN
jgi:hypothetical protein